MALGRRKEKQTELFIPTAQLAQGPGHPFYSQLNAVLAQARFDEFVEKLCAPYYKEGGRPSIPPGVYFRMLFIGYFEGLDSQRGIAWRCADSLALRAFLGVAPTESTPVHASMSIIRQRLPETLFDAVFTFVLGLLADQGLLQGKTLGIDGTTLEANAAMKSIVRKDTGADWKEYLRTLARAEGIENPTEEQLRRLDRNRPDKKVSNQAWHSPIDPDSRIAKMKDGRTHLAYKAEHTVDLQSEAIVAAHVTHADRGDAETGAESLIVAQANLVACDEQLSVEELVADKGYHDNRLLTQCADWQVRTYIPERQQKSRCWTDKPPESEAAFRANRRRVRGDKGRRLNRWRSERCERSFAHVCETGGGRRSWLRGLVNVSKAHVLKCAAYNLGLLLRKIWGLSKPRNWPEVAGAFFRALLSLSVLRAVMGFGVGVEPMLWLLGSGVLLLMLRVVYRRHVYSGVGGKRGHFLTGC
jgi:transposase